MEDYIIEKIRIFCIHHRIPIDYIAIIILNSIALSYLKVFKNWQNSRSGSKWSACITVFVAIVLDLIWILLIIFKN
jgi:hypothetical protein